MPKRIKQQKRPTDVNQLAHRMVKASTEDEIVQPPTKEQISVFMAQLGHKGGKIGGKRRLETLSPQQRKRIARKAAHARWAKETKL